MAVVEHIHSKRESIFRAGLVFCLLCGFLRTLERQGWHHLLLDEGHNTRVFEDPRPEFCAGHISEGTSLRWVTSNLE